MVPDPDVKIVIVLVPGAGAGEGLERFPLSLVIAIAGG
jgi:hypothetical protein